MQVNTARTLQAELAWCHAGTLAETHYKVTGIYKTAGKGDFADTFRSLREHDTRFAHSYGKQVIHGGSVIDPLKFPENHRA